MKKNILMNIASTFFILAITAKAGELERALGWEQPEIVHVSGKPEPTFEGGILRAKDLRHKKMTFVKEYSTYAKNFIKDDTSVASIDVSFCHLLEISNWDEKNKRTAFSLTHFTTATLEYPEIVESSLKKILRNFENQGGDVSTAKIRIFGGTYRVSARTALRATLKHAFAQVCPKCSVHIEEPNGHYMEKNDQVLDYIFTQEATAYCKMVERNDPTKDICSGGKAQEGRFRKLIDDAYYPVSNLLDRQTSAIYQKIKAAHSIDKLKPLLEINVVSSDGRIRQ